MNSPFDFSALIAPSSIADFVSDYWEKKFLFINRNSTEYYDDLITIDDLETLLLNKRTIDGTIRLVKDGASVRETEWTNIQNIDTNTLRVVDSHRIYSLFGQGVTIILEAADRAIGTLASCCLNLERELRFHLQANLYITPHNSQGFAPHYDTHDVMILQVMGRKLWKLYDSPVFLPSEAQKHEPGKYPLPEPTAELVLEPGDLLYIPRGLIHDAHAMNTGSVHITLGLYPHTYYDLFRELAAACRNDPAFRTSIPAGLLGASRREDWLTNIKSQLNEYINHVDFRQLVSQLDDRVVNDPRCDHRNRLGDLMRIAGLNQGSSLIRRRSIRPVVTLEEKLVKIQCAGKTLEFPIFLRPSLEIMQQDAPFTVREIRGLINDEGKIELARKMIQEGFLEIVDLG